MYVIIIKARWRTVRTTKNNHVSQECKEVDFFVVFLGPKKKKNLKRDLKFF